MYDCARRRRAPARRPASPRSRRPARSSAARRELVRLVHERLGDGAVEVSLAAGLGLEGVEDAVWDGPSLSANQVVVSGSALTSSRPPSRSCSTSSSLPGLASSATQSPTATIVFLSSFGPRQAIRWAGGARSLAADLRWTMASGGFVRRHADAVALIALTVLGALLISPQLGPHVRPSPDILFYEAQKRELLGTDAQTAREEVFTSRFAAPLIADEQELSPDDRRVANPAWREYSAKIYRRRWVVPALAAGLDPVFGDQSSGDPGADRMADPRAAPLSVSAPALRAHGERSGQRALRHLAADVRLRAQRGHGRVSAQPRRGGAGLPVEAAQRCSRVVRRLVRTRRSDRLHPRRRAGIDRRGRLVGGCGAIAHRRGGRTRGAAASVPPLVAFGAPLQSQLAYILNDFRIPEETSWGSILHDYPGGLGRRGQVGPRLPARPHGGSADVRPRGCDHVRADPALRDLAVTVTRCWTSPEALGLVGCSRS